MWERELPITNVTQALAVVRALGKHRYVAGRKHFVHALAAFDLPDSALGSWAREIIGDGDIDKASRDERLVRAVSDDELGAVLSHFWSAETAGRACDCLLDALERFDVDVVSSSDPFAGDEDAVFPILIDAGFELLALSELDAERHRGAIEAYGERIHFDVARFEEEEAVPPIAHLQELPVFGVVELVRGARDGELAEPFCLWLAGNETYQDYVIRGVLRAAKI